MEPKRIIIKSVKKAFGASLDDIRSDSRPKELFFARCAMANILLSIGMSLHMTGDVINRSHSTVAYYKKQHPILLKQSPYYKNCFTECLNDLADIYR